MSEITRVTLVDQVTEALAALIRDRGLQDGDPIPATADLAKEFSVSRTVVREAVSELAGRGLLRRQQGRESVVIAPGSEHLERLLRYRMESAGIPLDQVQQYREFVEVATARLAARNASDEDLARLDEMVEAQRGLKAPAKIHEADIAVHRAIAEASKNEMLVLTLNGITPLLTQVREQAWAGWVSEGEDLDAIVGAHAAIVEAIRAHDEEAAGRAMEAHLGQARHGLDIATEQASAPSGER